MSDTDLVVYAFKNPDDPTTGAFFSIPATTYTDPQFEMTNGSDALPRALLMNGTIVANMQNDGTGVGGFCYLISLPALRPPTVNPLSARPKMSPADLIKAVKGLVGRVPAPPVGNPLFDKFKKVSDAVL